jgi:UV DNA damage repair endonuclease
MKIGYACLTVGVPGTQHRTCAMKSVTPNVLTGLIQSNLDALDHILDYNIRNGIKLFRISSDIITFGSHPINTVKWWEVFKDQLDAIGQKAKANGLRLSMHPANTRCSIPRCGGRRGAWMTAVPYTLPGCAGSEQGAQDHPPRRRHLRG